MAQFYFGVGSPYWASKGMLGLALPADHLVWAAEEEALPVEKEDTHRLISTPGWMVSGTSADGVVRVLNIGTMVRTRQTLSVRHPCTRLSAFPP